MTMVAAVPSRYVLLFLGTFFGLFFILSQTSGFQARTDILCVQLRNPLETATSASSNSPIPNYVHFVFLLEDPHADFPLEIYHFLSVYSALYYLRPEKIFFSTNASPDQITRARDGQAGKWSKLIFNAPGFTVNKVEMPRLADNGLEIKHIAHKSDFIRVQAIQKFGGIYLDMDVYPLRDFKPLRESGFNTVVGREPGGLMTAGAFLARKTSRLVNTWARQMPVVFDGGWITHSNILMTTLGEQLIPTPGELLVLEQDALCPVGSTDEAATEFLQSHDDVASNLDHIINGTEFHDDHPSWAMNWNKSYLVHAFHIEESSIKITARSILDRRSRFSRAVYPVAKDLLDRGIISIDDE